MMYLCVSKSVGTGEFRVMVTEPRTLKSATVCKWRWLKPGGHCLVNDILHKLMHVCGALFGLEKYVGKCLTTRVHSSQSNCWGGV